MNPEKDTENRDPTVEAKITEQGSHLILELSTSYVSSFPHVYESQTINSSQTLLPGTTSTLQRTDAQHK